MIKVPSTLEVCDFMKRHSLASLISNLQLLGLLFKLFNRDENKNLKFQNLIGPQMDFEFITRFQADYSKLEGPVLSVFWETMENSVNY
jgi:hypothetical protein